MKILTENGLYIQKSDLILLQNTKIGIPLKVQKDINKNNISESNPNEFIRFTKEETINYFKDQEWIVDYKLVNAMSHEQIIRIYKVLKDKIMDKILFYSDSLNYEAAKELKDELQYIDIITNKQKIELHDYVNRDVIGYIFKNGMICIQYRDSFYHLLIRYCI
mgnify:CR=1 FL=1